MQKGPEGPFLCVQLYMQLLAASIYSSSAVAYASGAALAGGSLFS